MNLRTRNFLIGSLSAITLTAAVTDVRVLEAINEIPAFNSVSPELRLGVDLGILDASELDSASLSAPITRRSFAVILKQVLQLVGAPTGSELSDLHASGIFNPAPHKRGVSRKAALEALARTTIYLSDNGFITLEEKPAGDFADYRIPEKYSQAIAFLREKEIARGYPDGRFGVSRLLSKREAVSLLYRFYEQISSSLMMRGDTKGLQFVDLPLDHPAMASLKAMENAGAFDTMKFSRSFDGYSPLRINEAVTIIESILNKYSHTEEAAEVKSLLSDPSSTLPTTRGELTILLGHMVKAFPAEIGIIPEAYCYNDVAAGTKEAVALEALGNKGLFIGYPNGTFMGMEVITRFEAVGIIGTVLTTLQLVPSESGEQLAGKSDFEAFANLLREKRARIQSILHRKPRTPEKP